MQIAANENRPDEQRSVAAELRDDPLSPADLSFAERNLLDYLPERE